MPCYVAGYVLWALVTTEPLTVGLWVASGVAAAFLTSRLAARTPGRPLGLALMIVLALATLPPLVHSLSEMHARSDDAPLIAMGLLAAAIASVVLALLARIVGQHWHANLLEDKDESDHRRFGLAFAAGVFVTTFAFLAFFCVGMALTG